MLSAEIELISPKSCRFSGVANEPLLLKQKPPASLMPPPPPVCGSSSGISGSSRSIEFRFCDRDLLFSTVFRGASEVLVALSVAIAGVSLSLISAGIFGCRELLLSALVAAASRTLSRRPNLFVWLEFLAIIILAIGVVVVLMEGLVFTFEAQLALLAAFLFAVRVVGFRFVAANVLPLTSPRRALRNSLAWFSRLTGEDEHDEEEEEEDDKGEGEGEDPPRRPPCVLCSQQVTLLLLLLTCCLWRAGGSLGLTRLTAVRVSEDVDEVKLNLLNDFNGLLLNCSLVMVVVVVVVVAAALLSCLRPLRWTSRFNARLDLLVVGFVVNGDDNLCDLPSVGLTVVVNLELCALVTAAAAAVSAVAGVSAAAVAESLKGEQDA